MILPCLNFLCKIFIDTYYDTTHLDTFLLGKTTGVGQMWKKFSSFFLIFGEWQKSSLV